MTYSKTIWANGGPARLSAANLNKIEDELEYLDGQLGAVNVDYVERSFVDSGSTDYYPGVREGVQGGLWVIEAVCNGVCIGVGLVAVGGYTSDGGVTKVVNVISSQVASNWAGFAITAVGSPGASAVIRVATANGSGATVFVRYRRLAVRP